MPHCVSAALVLAAVAACGGSNPADQTSRASPPAATSPSPSPKTVATGEVHGVPYAMTYGRQGGGFCLTLRLDAEAAKGSEVCNIGPNTIDAFGFARLDGDRGAIFGTLPDIATSATYQFDDGTVLRAQAQEPTDRSAPIRVYVLPTPPKVYGKPFIYAPFERGDVLLGPFAYRGEALTEAQVRNFKPVQ